MIYVSMYLLFGAFIAALYANQFHGRMRAYPKYKLTYNQSYLLCVVLSPLMLAISFVIVVIAKALKWFK